MLRAVAALGLLLAACAPKTGWKRTDRRVCAADTAALVCLVAEPDRPALVDIGGVQVLHGECVLAPAPDAKGSLPVTVVDGQGRQQVHRIRVRKASINTVELAADGLLAVRRVDPCDSRVPER